MNNTVLWTENNERKTDFIKKSFLRAAVVGFIVLVFEIISYIISGNYWLVASCSTIGLILGFNIWAIVVKNHYYANLTFFGFYPVWILALVYTFIQGDIFAGISWTFVCIAVTYFILPQRKAWIANGIVLIVLIPFVWQSIDYGQAIQVALSLGIISASLAIFITVITNQQKQLHLLAATDSLTGLFNRTIFYQSLERAIEQSKRKDLDMTLVTFDIDHFKAINDTYGHDVGDDVLRKLSALLMQRVRQADKAFRVGGEEFTILLFGTNHAEGQLFAEKLRKLVADTELIKDYPVTISLGVSTLLANEDWTNWVKRGDENLYYAKSNGRNQVES